VAVPTPTLYVNVWFDWNRDADWDDVLGCVVFNDAPEWAVQNQQLVGLAAGLHTITPPQFLPWHPVGATERMPIWMRIYAVGASSGPTSEHCGLRRVRPLGGYEIGETEDYYFIRPRRPLPGAVCGPTACSGHCPLDAESLGHRGCGHLRTRLGGIPVDRG